MLLKHIDNLILELKLDYKEAGKALINAATHNGYRDIPGSSPIKSIPSSNTSSKDTEVIEKKSLQKEEPKLKVEKDPEIDDKGSSNVIK